MVDVGLGKHGVAVREIIRQSRRILGLIGTYYSSSLFRRGGVLPAMITSLAFPERRVLRVDLNPRVT